MLPSLTPLLALIPRAVDCRLARLSVLYLNTWRICSPPRCSLVALCVRERKNSQPPPRSPPLLTVSQLSLLFLLSLSLSNKKKKKEIPFLVRGDAAFLPSPPLRALLVAQSSLRSRVMRRSIQINLDTGKKSVSRPIPSWLGHQRKTSIFVSVGVRDPSDSGSLLALDHCRRERRREHASCITVL